MTIWDGMDGCGLLGPVGTIWNCVCLEGRWLGLCWRARENITRIVLFFYFLSLFVLFSFLLPRAQMEPINEEERTGGGDGLPHCRRGSQHPSSQSRRVHKSAPLRKSGRV